LHRTASAWKRHMRQGPGSPRPWIETMVCWSTCASTCGQRD